MMNKKDKIIVVLGPTASGKSGLAVKIALHLSSGQARKTFGINGIEIISADSRQVYKGLDLGSGKVTKDLNSKLRIQSSEFYHQGIRHHLLDIASPKNRFTVAQYQKLAKKAIKKIIAKGKIPIICGGTAFYIYSLIYNWQIPEVPPQKKLREKLEKKSIEELFKQLKKLDPQRAKNIDKYNKRRLIRALEIVLITGKPNPHKSDLNQRTATFDVLIIGIKKPKEELQKLIKIRLEKRLKQGMIEEIKKLYQRGLTWKRLDELGLEYRYISYYLRELITKEKMIEILNQKTWQFSKRQMTWFKKDKIIKWIKNYKEAKKLVKNFLY
ncbi:MAG: tRNA (adenosine(37)-N6)-dimethylallyltransferase MiaA [Candidatus Paceibacterota bacterium]